MKDESKKLADLKTQIAALKKEITRLKKSATSTRSSKSKISDTAIILDSFFRDTVTPLVLLDKNFDFIRVNEAYARACQRPVSDFPGHNHFEFYPSDAREIFDKVVETKEAAQVNARPFTFPDHPEWGTTYWDWKLTPLLDKKGEVEFLVFSLEDVTERKRAEIALYESEESYRALFENVNAAVSLFEPIMSEDGRLIDLRYIVVNSMTEKALGKKRGKIEGKLYSEIFHLKERNPIFDIYEMVIKTGEPFKGELYSPALKGHYDMTIYRPAPNRLAALFADITELKKTQAAALESDRKFRSLFEFTPTGFVLGKLIYDENGEACDILYLDANPAYEKLTAVKRSDLVGKTTKELYPETPRDWFEMYAEVARTGVPVERERYLKNLDRYLYNYYSSPGKDLIASSVIDITERRKAEQALQTSESRYRALFESSLTGHGVFDIIIDEAGKLVDAFYIDVNSAWEKMMGRSRKEIIGKSVFEIFRGLDRSWLDRYVEVVKSGKPIEYEDYFKSADIYVKAIAYSPRPGQCAVDFIDITEAKIAEIALKQSEARYRGLFSNLTSPYYLAEIIYDTNGKPADARYLDVNPAFAKFAQREAGQLIGKTLNEILPKFSEAPVFEKMVTAAAGSGGFQEESKSFYNPDRIIKHYLYSPSPGQVAGIVEDITEREHDDQVIRDLATFPKENPNPIIRISRSNIILYANTSCEPLLACWHTKIGDELPKQIYRKIIDASSSGLRNEFEIEVGNKNYWMLVVDIPVRDYLTVYGKDITERKKAEEALRESEQKFRSLFNNMLTGFAIFEIIYDQSGQYDDIRFIDVNPVYEPLVGLKRSDVIGKTAKELFPGIEDDWLQVYSKVAETGKPVRAERFNRHINKYFDIFIYKFAEGMVAANFIDITERKKSQTAIEESEQKFRSIFTGSIDGIALHKAIYDDDGKLINSEYLDVNPALCKMLNKNRDDMIGELSIGFLPETDESWKKPAEQVLKTGEPFGADQYSKDLDKYFEIWLYKSGPDQIAVIRRDVTEQKKAEIALRESEEKFRATFEEAAIGRSITAPDGRMIKINRALAEMVGYSIDELIEANIAKITHPDDVAISMEAIRTLVSEKCQTYNFEKRYIHKNGHLVYVTVSTILLRDSGGKPQYLIADIVDITERKLAEEKLRQAVVYGRSLIESSLDPLVTIAPDGKITDVNAATEAVTGLMRDELIGTDFSDYFTDPGKARAGYEHVFREGFVKDYSLEVKHCDGHITPVLYNASLYRDEKGEVIGIFAAARDITDRKKAEEAVRRAGAYNRSLLESSLDPLVTISPDGKVTDVNFATESITGFGRSELIGTDFSDYFTEPDKARQGYQHVFREGYVTDYALEVKHRDGHITSVIYNASLYKDEAGNVIGIFAAARDITERKRAEERVARLNRLYSVLSEINEAIVRIREVDVLYREACHIAVEGGHFRMAWIGLVDEKTKLVNPVAVAGYDGGYLETIKIAAGNTVHAKGPTGTSIRENMYAVCSDIETDPRMGPWREEALKRGYRSSAAFPLVVESKVIGAFTLYADRPNYFDDEEIQLLVSLANDISFAIESIAQEKRRGEAEEEIRSLNEELEQRVKVRTAELEASNKELEAFSYSVSHDLRAPLRAIDGFSRIILEDYLDKLDDEGKRVLGVIRKNTQDMGRLIDDLLTFSRTGRQKLNPIRINMANMAQMLFDDIKVTVPDRNIVFDINDPPLVWADNTLIRQALINLISNAVKFTGSRDQAKIEFGGRSEDHENVYYLKDNGVGFDMQYADKLFGVFQRLHRHDEFEGTGVGLAIVQRIIHMHGGRVWAESKINEGAIFYFTLPI